MLESWGSKGDNFSEDHRWGPNLFPQHRETFCLAELVPFILKWAPPSHFIHETIRKYFASKGMVQWHEISNTFKGRETDLKPAPALTGCGILAKSHHLSDPQFLHLSSDDLLHASPQHWADIHCCWYHCHHRSDGFAAVAGGGSSHCQGPQNNSEH